MAKVTYTVETELSPNAVWDALTEFGPRRAELWPDLSPSSFKVLERGENWARVREGTANLGIWSIERYEWAEPVITADGRRGERGAVGRQVADGGPAAARRRKRAHDLHEPARQGLRRPHGPWLFQVTKGRFLAARTRRMLANIRG